VEFTTLPKTAYLYLRGLFLRGRRGKKVGMKLEGEGKERRGGEVEEQE